MVREPQNTVSNLAYVLVGAAVFLAARRTLSLSFGAAGIFLGIGSGLYHASLLPEWRLLDILGVYAVLFGLVAIGICALLRKAGDSLAIASLKWLAAFGAGVHRNDVRILGFKVLDSTYVVVGSVVVAVGLVLACSGRIPDRKRKWQILGTLGGSGSIAFFGGAADRFGGVWSNPQAFVQGHAVWHLFGAIALLAAYESFAFAGYDRSVFQGSPGGLHADFSEPSKQRNLR